MNEGNHIEEYIVRYLQDDICDRELEELNTWIQASEENKVLFFQIKSIHDSSKKNRHIAPIDAAESWERMHARIQPETKTENPRLSMRKIVFRVFRYTAIVGAAVATGWYMALPDSLQPSTDIVPEISYAEIRIEKGGKGNKVILPDGSQVTLNAATRFTYPVDFNQTDREVYLDGEAYFEIARDTLKPFKVRSGKQVIHVLGTTFNVRAYQDEAQSVTTLVEGSISLETFNEHNESVSRMFLQPHQEAVSDHRTGSVSLRHTDPSFASAWLKGEYKFRDEPLEVIARKLENYYGVHIHLEDDSLKRIFYTGTFSMNQDIQELLQVINYDKKYHFKRIGNDIFIQPR